MSFLAILEVLNFYFSKLEQISRPKFTKIQSSRSPKLPKMTFLDRLNSTKSSLNFIFWKFLEHIAMLWNKRPKLRKMRKSYKGTMLQKLSKCEVKAWLCWDLIILPPLRFYVKSNFGKFKRSKNVIFGNCRASELRNLVNLALDCAQIYQKSKFRSSKIVKNNIFEPFEFTKILFHAKSEWQ